MKERAIACCRRESRRGGDNGDSAHAPDAILARLRHGADAMTDRAAGLKKLADAAEPLYKSLDDGQKHRFAMLLRMGGRGRLRRRPPSLAASRRRAVTRGRHRSGGGDRPASRRSPHARSRRARPAAFSTRR